MLDFVRKIENVFIILVSVFLTRNHSLPPAKKLKFSNTEHSGTPGDSNLRAPAFIITQLHNNVSNVIDQHNDHLPTPHILRTLNYSGAEVDDIRVNNVTLADFFNVTSIFTTNTTNGSYATDNEMPQIPSYIRTTSIVFCVTIMILGVIGNIMVPIVIFKTKDMRNSTNIFLTNLSIADLLVLLVCTPTVLVEVNTRPETWILGEELCKAVPFVELTVAHASVLTILAISFERYYAICEPLKAGYVCTKTRALLICLIAWAIAALFTSPIILVAEYKFEEYIDGSYVTVCLTQATNRWSMGYFLMTISLFFILPLFILIILYTIIARNLIAKDGAMLKIRPTKPELSYKARKQVVLMLGAVVMSFFLCLLPFRMLTLWIVISTEEMYHSIGLEGYYIILYFSRIMLYLNSAINPFLYNLLSSKFRKGFLKLCCWCHPLKNQLRVRPRTATLNTTTTTTSSSILSRSFNRRTNNKTSSLDELRYRVDSVELQGAECEKDLLRSFSNNTSLEKRCEFKKVSVFNNKETSVTFASTESISSEEVEVIQQSTFSMANQRSAKTRDFRFQCRRQISFDSSLITELKEKHKIVFQQSIE